MRWLAWLDTLNLMTVFNYYLIMAFFVSTGIRVRTYRAIVGLVLASPRRWPKLMALVKKHRSLFLGWPILLAIGLAFGLMLSNSVAIHLVWPAKVTFEELWVRWLPLLAVIVSGGLMLLLDCQAIFNRRRFDRIALEADLDKAESWLKSWMAPAPLKYEVLLTPSKTTLLPSAEMLGNAGTQRSPRESIVTDRRESRRCLQPPLNCFM